MHQWDTFSTGWLSCPFGVTADGTLSIHAGFRSGSDVGIAFVVFGCKQFAFPRWLRSILRETATLGASFTGRAGAFISAPAILGASFLCTPTNVPQVGCLSFRRRRAVLGVMGGY